MTTGTPLLRIRGVSKAFPGLRALDGVDLDVSASEIVAVVGQNGSGKSTLVKILAGVYDPAPGARIEVLGPGGVVLHGAAAQAELHFIHQDLGLIPTLSTVENLDLGRAYGVATGLKPVRPRHERRAAEELVARFGASFDVSAPVAQLSTSERTIVAIARALDGWTRPEHVLVLDEPTAALHGDEVGLLFEAVRRVAALGAGVVFISHRLDEVLDLPHRVVVLRDGRKVADVPTDSVSQGDLVRMIVGRELAETERTPAAHGDVALEVTGLQGPTVHNVDLTVRSGEIVGVTGILGSGREHLAGLVFGARPRAAGEVRVAGRTVSGGDPRAAVAAGVGFVPADRRASGGVMTMSARENLTLPLLAPLRRRLGWLDGSAERREALRWADELELRPPDPDRPLGLFSGGNQQKVVLAKWLRIKPTVLLLDEPTQGVDVGAKAAVYELIDGIAAQGAAVMVTSSDTKELAYLCDRVIVLRDGDIAAQVTHDTLTDERLVIESLGLKPEEASQLFGHELEVSDAR